MNLFYVPNISGERFVLEKDESKHIVRVLRKVKGDTVFITDGKGHIFTCAIEEAHPAACSLTVMEKKPGNDLRDVKLSLAVAPTKNIARYEWFLEKSTEIGVDHIFPFFSEHSERTSIKPERLKRVLISAMKQSQKGFTPVSLGPSRLRTETAAIVACHTINLMNET
ncbi:MAG: RsmE family RNA methyltransferase [bacterium]